jgi:hypothetical protein
MKAFSIAALAGLALCAPARAQNPATDSAAMRQLIDAVSLDVMSEASVEACEDMGAPSAPQVRTAWVAWRERHQIAPLRMVLADLKRRQGSTPSWTQFTEPLRQRVLSDTAPDRACAALAADWQGAGMDVSQLFPQARAVAQALVRSRVATAPTPPAIASGAAQGQVLLPSQVPALAAQQARGWTGITHEQAERALGQVYVKGRVARWGAERDRYQLVQQQGDREARLAIVLDANAEPWVGREVVVRGVFTSLDGGYARLSGAAIVSDPSGLSPSPLPQEPLVRRAVLVQRVTSPPGQGLPARDLAAIVVHGAAHHGDGTRWEDDVRFLLRDGTLYRRAGMPPDQLDVAASRRLEPEQWGRWRAMGRGYEMQLADGAWQPAPHRAVRPWPGGTRLAGSFSHASFRGSTFLGGTASTRSIRFMPDGRFERSVSALSSTGTLAAIRNGTVVAGSSRSDGEGSRHVGGGSIGDGGVGAFTSRQADDGASRRGRYEFNGFALTLHYDDGRLERLLSFPMDDARKTVYVGTASYSLDH